MAALGAPNDRQLEILAWIGEGCDEDPAGSLTLP